MKFTDGMEIDTSGPLRVIRERDGFYVVGEGILAAVDSREEGEALIETLREKGEPRCES